MKLLNQKYKLKEEKPKYREFQKKSEVKATQRF